MDGNRQLNWMRGARRKLLLAGLGAVIAIQALGGMPAVQAEVPFRTSQLDLIPSLEKPKASEEAYAFQQLDEDYDAPGQTQPLQGSITSIKVTVGRSQIVKFAQPVMRLSIADPRVADVVALSPDQIMINGKLRGVTSLIVWDENGQEGIFDLYVQNDTSELLDAVAAVAPNEKIQARVTDDSFILTGQVSNTVILDEIRRTAAAYGFREDKFVDLTETPVPQVVLEVRIAEASRSTSRELKTSFQTLQSRNFSLTRLGNAIDNTILTGSFDSGGLQRATNGIIPGATAATTVVQGLGPNGPIGVPGVWNRLTDKSQWGLLGLTQAADNIGGITGSFQPFRGWETTWDFLETKGKVKTLANPTLVCTHGREASFLAGGEFPFVSGTDQNGSPIIAYKDFGVKLNFTPWIAIRSGRIELKMGTEVSNVDTTFCLTGPGGQQICGLNKRSTDTTVELADGESLMISGILSREETNLFGQVPFIANVPIIGNLFKNGDMSKADRELVVVITPRIIKPADYGKLLGTAN